MDIDMDMRLDEINAVKEDIKHICERLKCQDDVVVLKEFDLRLLIMKDKELTELIAKLYKDMSDPLKGLFTDEENSSLRLRNSD